MIVSTEIAGVYRDRACAGYRRQIIADKIIVEFCYSIIGRPKGLRYSIG
jgi:hypothetical protein